MNNSCARMGQVLTLWLLAHVIAGAAPAKADEVVAIVAGIEGKVYWKQASGKPQVQLSPSKDKARRLHLGEWVKIEPGGSLHLLLGLDAQQTVATPANAKAQWMTFPRRPTKEQADMLKVLEANSELGGRKRGGQALYSPADRSTVRRERLSFRWTPSPRQGRVTLVLTDSKKRRKFWDAVDLDGLAGTVNPNPARAALKDYEGSLALAFTSAQQSEVAGFALLDRASETRLEKELANCNRYAGLARRLGRIAAFQRYKLLNEAAEELEAALSESPNSTSLLAATIMAEERTGNRMRSQELRKRLQPGTHVPGDQPAPATPG